MAAASPFQPEQISKVTRQLEQGNALGLQQLLQGHTENERVAALNEIKTQNAQDRAGNSSLPQVTFGTSVASDGYDYESVRVNHKQIFYSTLDINSLTRYDEIDNKPVGTPQKVLGTPADSKLVRQVTSLLEDGKGVEAGALINQLPSEEQRIQLLQAVGTQNTTDFNAKSTKVSLGILVDADKSGHNILGVWRMLPGWPDDFYGGTQIYGDQYTVATSDHEPTSNKEDTRPSP